MTPLYIMILGSVLITGCAERKDATERVPRNDPIQRLVTRLKNAQHVGHGLPNGPALSINLPRTASISELVSQSLFLGSPDVTNATILATRKVHIEDVVMASSVEAGLNLDYTAVLVKVGVKTNIVLLKPEERGAGWEIRVYNVGQ